MNISLSNWTFYGKVSASTNNKTEYNFWDNPNDIFSFESLRTVEKTVQCGFVPSLFVIGAPTNIITMIVFYRQGLRDRMNLCLFSLAFVDLMFVTSSCTMVSYCLIGVFLPTREMFWRSFLTKHILNFVYGFANSSSCLTMIISVERCLCVIFPIKSTALISHQTMGVIVSATILSMQVLCGLYIVKEEIYSVKDAVTGEEIIVLVNSELYLSNTFFRIVEDIVLSFISLFSFSAVFLTTAATILGLRSALTWRKKTAR